MDYAIVFGLGVLVGGGIAIGTQALTARIVRDRRIFTEAPKVEIQAGRPVKTMIEPQSGRKL